MSTGRPPRPAHLRIDGNGKLPQGIKDINQKELYSTTPVAPKHLTKGATAIFDMYLNERLRPYGLASSVDTEALALLSTITEQVQQLYRDIARNGWSEQGATGGPHTRPEARMYAVLTVQMKQMLEQFGLTPSARARVPPRTNAAADQGAAATGFSTFVVPVHQRAS